MAAATTEALSSLASTANVVVHPLVLLSIQDHAARAAKGTKKRVVGILLGQDLGPKGINVANSFAVPFEEDDKDPKTWFLDHNYIESMNDMFKKVNAREKLIGWYHTGPKLRSSDLEINQVVKRYTPRPVMVIVDVRPEHERGGAGSGIPTDAYFAVEEIKDDGTATQKTFMHVPSSIEAEEAEEIGVEHLLRDVSNRSVGTLSTKVVSQLAALRGLQSRLVEVTDYLAAVSQGTLPVNHQIIYNLQDIFNLLPNLDLAERGGQIADLGKRPFTVATNDQLLVVYLSSLIRAVIALHDLVLNKQAGQDTSDDATDKKTSSTDEKDTDKDEKKKETKTDAQKAADWFKEGDKEKEKKDKEEKRGL